MDDSKSRLVIWDTGGGMAYVCEPCIAEVHRNLTVKITYVQKNWTMSLKDFVGWIDPAGRTLKPGADDMRETMSRFEERARELLKDFQEYKNGYTDRGKFLLDIRKHLRDVNAAVEAYLQKTA